MGAEGFQQQYQQSSPGTERRLPAFGHWEAFTDLVKTEMAETGSREQGVRKQVR